MPPHSLIAKSDNGLGSFGESFVAFFGGQTNMIIFFVVVAGFLAVLAVTFLELHRYRKEKELEEQEIESEDYEEDV